MTPNCIKRIVVIFKTREIFSRTFRGVTGASGEITQLLSVDDRVSTSDAAVRGKLTILNVRPIEGSLSSVLPASTTWLRT